jgi:hypothetical protein
MHGRLCNACGLKDAKNRQKNEELLAKNHPQEERPDKPTSSRAKMSMNYLCAE